jgi:hypothetical protein
MLNREYSELMALDDVLKEALHDVPGVGPVRLMHMPHMAGAEVFQAGGDGRRGYSIATITEMDMCHLGPRSTLDLILGRVRHFSSLMQAWSGERRLVWS